MATRRALRSSQAASAAVGSKNGPKSGDAGVGKLFKLDSQRRDKIERNLDFFRAKPASSGSKGANWIPPKPPLSGSETRDEEVGAEGSEAQRPEASLAASTSKGKGLKRKLPDDFDAPVNNPTIIDQIQSKAPSPFPKAPPNTPAGSPFSPRSPNARGQPEPLANDPGKNLQNASRGAEHVLNASEKVRYEKAKIKIKELKAKNQILERTVKEQSQHILSLERSVASARDKLELPDFLQPQFLKKITSKVITAFVRGSQFWSTLYPEIDTVLKVFLAELNLGHRSDVRRFTDHWHGGFGQSVMTKLGDRRSKLGGRFRQSLGDTTETSDLAVFPASLELAAERKARMLAFQSDMSWVGGPNRDEDTGELESGEDDTQEMLKGKHYRIAFKMAMGGVYTETMRARQDVFAYFLRVGELYWLGQQMSSTNVNRDREVIREYEQSMIEYENNYGLKYARLIKKRAPPEDLNTAPTSAWRILKAGESLDLAGECSGGDRSDDESGSDTE